MIEKLYQHYLRSSGVSTDTRTIEKDNIWFALKGPNFNANKFADQALSKGAALVVVDDDAFCKDERYFLVEDCLIALQQLATHHRRQLKIPFLAITGSNGKTTTKELVRDVLAMKYNVKATEGNLNNHIGVPLTLLKLDEATDFAVVEMGANAQKEIKMLCEIAEPDFGMITNIGKAHLEGFGGLEGVFKGKTEMYDHLAKHGGSAFVNTNFPRLVEKLQALQIPFKAYPNHGDDLELQLLEEDPNLVLRFQGETFRTTLTGGYNADNIAAALCIGVYFGVDISKAIEAVIAYDPDNNRSQIIEVKGNRVVLDAYNANPSSMSVALKSFNNREGGQKVVVLGDMLELGDEAYQEHQEIGRLTTQLDLDEVHFCGPQMAAAKELNPTAYYWERKDELCAYLKKRGLQGHQILIKGSRGMSLETILDCL